MHRHLALLLFAVAVSARAELPNVDRFGDPLPDGAVARLGSMRFTHSAALEQFAFAADGKTIVFFGRDNIVGRWDAVSVKELSRVQLRRSSLRGTIISGDGAMLVTTSPSEGLFVWDTATGKELRRLPAINGPNPLMAWLKDGRSLFVIDNQGVVHICDVTDGRELSRWPASTERIVSLRASPDAQRVAVINDAGIVSLCEPETGKELLKLETVPVRPRSRSGTGGFIFSPNGKMLVRAAPSLPFKAWDVDTGKPLEQFKAIEQMTRSFPAVFSPDSRTLVTADMAKVRFWDVASGKESAAMDCGTVMRTLKFSPDGRRLAGCGMGSAALELWDAKTHKPLRREAGHRAAVERLAFLDAGRIATGGADGLAAAWDVRDGRLIDVNRFRQGTIQAFAVPRPGELRICDNTGDLWQWQPGQPAAIAARHHAMAYGRALSKDGQLLASVFDETGVRVVAAMTRKEISSIRIVSIYAHFLQFSPDGSLLATISSEGSDDLRIWKTTTGKQFCTLLIANPEEPGGWAIIFSPVQHTAATLGGNGQVRIWELANSSVRRLVSFDAGFSPSALAYTPDGRGLAFGLFTGEIIYLDLMTGLMSKRWAGQRGAVTALAFSQDGRLLASGGSDTTALIWDVAKLRPASEPGHVTAADAERCWRELADKHGPPVMQAIGTLASAPAVSLPLLAERLQPPRLPARERLDGWLHDLDDARFSVREKATKALAELGEDVADLLLSARPQAKAEGRRRIDSLLAAAEARPTAVKLQALRGLEVAELIGTPEARQLLERLASLPEDTWLKREARATLERLKKRD